MKKMISSEEILSLFNSDVNLPNWALELIKERVGTFTNIDELTPSKLAYLQGISRKVKRGIPISKILGIKYFYNGSFINKNVLDPRYDSEIIVDVLYYIKTQYQPDKFYNIVELGGGSGCLSVTAASVLPQCMLTIVEKSPTAIKTLGRNLKRNNVEKRTTIYEGCWWEPIKSSHKSFDILIFNPPYLSLEDILIKESIYNTYEDPLIALYGGITGLEPYIQVLSGITNYVNDFAIVEICYLKLPAILEILYKYNLTYFQIFNDLTGNPRMLLIDLRNLS